MKYHNNIPERERKKIKGGILCDTFIFARQNLRDFERRYATQRTKQQASILRTLHAEEIEGGWSVAIVNYNIPGEDAYKKRGRGKKYPMILIKKKIL